MTLTIVILCFLLPLVACFLGVAGLRRWGSHLLVVDVPNDRSSHERPVLRGGGFVIVMVVLTSLGVYQAAVGRIFDWRTFVIFSSGAGFVALVSWLDDVHGLTNGARLVAQVLAALNAISIFGYWHYIAVPFVGEIHLGFLGLPFTMLWVIGLANAFNFMDGTDGLAASQASVAGLLLAAGAWSLGIPAITPPALITAGACAGFLAHNWWPARIFMGDVGSVFIGYVYAILLVYVGRQSSALVIAGGLLFGVVILDTAFTFCRRAARKEPLFQSHRTHLYQRLAATGATHREIALLYAAGALLFGVLSLTWLRVDDDARALVIAGALGIVGAVWGAALRRERRLRQGAP